MLCKELNNRLQCLDKGGVLHEGQADLELTGVASRVYNRRAGEYPTLQCSLLQPFTGFMTFVMIFTNVWFHGLLSVTFRDSDVVLRKPVG